MAKREELNSKNSPLEFKLHRLKFIDLIRNGRCKEALDYAKNFSRFREHLKGMFEPACLSLVFTLQIKGEKL